MIDDIIPVIVYPPIVIPSPIIIRCTSGADIRLAHALAEIKKA